MVWTSGYEDDSTGLDTGRARATRTARKWRLEDRDADGGELFAATAGKEARRDPRSPIDTTAIRLGRLGGDLAGEEAAWYQHDQANHIHRPRDREAQKIKGLRP